MGRPPWSSREVVANRYDLSVDAMCREGVFASPAGSQWFTVWRDASGDEQFRIAYNVFRGPGGTVILGVSYGLYDSNSCATRVTKYDIHTMTSICHLGGERYWFTCPGLRRAFAAAAVWDGFNLELPPSSSHNPTGPADGFIRRTGAMTFARAN